MKMNRPPRTWSAANAAAAARPNTDEQSERVESAYDFDPLGDALGAYTNTPADAIDVVAGPDSDRVAFLPEVTDSAPESEPEPEPEVFESPAFVPQVFETEMSPAECNVVAIHSAQEAKVTTMATANPMSVETLVSRLHRTRSSIADALAYCGDAADEIAATAASFTAAAAHMRAVAVEQTELETLIAGAVSDLLALNESIDARQAVAMEDAATLLADTAREAEQLRATAIADVERARERLLQFTTEIGNVAFELQGGIGHERQSGQRIA